MAKATPSAAETARARRLRRAATDAESLLWTRLRGRQLGAKFRRQEPVLGFTVDFVAHKHGLVVEVDGGQHALDVCRDERRTRALEAAGYKVLRFWNNDVLGNPEGVLETILDALKAPAGPAAPSPRPSPRGGGGERPPPASATPLPPGERPGEGAPQEPAPRISATGSAPRFAEWPGERGAL